MEGSVVLACASSRATTATTLLPTSMASRGRRLSQAQVPPSRAQVSNRNQLQYSFYRMKGVAAVLACVYWRKCSCEPPF